MKISACKIAAFTKIDVVVSIISVGTKIDVQIATNNNNNNNDNHAI
jgi:hypothetical protein